ncbi:hypothetical protein [Paenibacillus jiagnxiensis]
MSNRVEALRADRGGDMLREEKEELKKAESLEIKRSNWKIKLR